MSYLLEFPSTLPNPSSLSSQGAERRLLSSINTGLPQTRSLQRDFAGTEDLQWMLDADQAEAWNSFWRYDLKEGGRWFQAAWPRVTGEVGVCRFTGTPQWTYAGNDYWQVTVKTEVAGRREPPMVNSTRLLLPLQGDLVDIAEGRIFLAVEPPAPEWDGSDPKFGSSALISPYRVPILSPVYDDLSLVGKTWELRMWVNSHNVRGGGGGGTFFCLGGPTTSFPQIAVSFDSITMHFKVSYYGHGPTITGLARQFVPEIVAGPHAVKGDWAFIVVACDATSIRGYVDGDLVLEYAGGEVENPIGAPYRIETVYLSMFVQPSGESEYFEGTLQDVQLLVGEVLSTGSTISVPTTPGEMT